MDDPTYSVPLNNLADNVALRVLQCFKPENDKYLASRYLSEALLAFAIQIIKEKK